MSKRGSKKPRVVKSAADFEERVADFLQVLRVVDGEARGLAYETQEALSEFESEPKFTPTRTDIAWARGMAKKIAALRDEINRYGI